MAISEQEREAIRRYAQALADEAPPLSPEQQDRIKALFGKRPGRQSAAA